MMKIQEVKVKASPDQAVKSGLLAAAAPSSETCLHDHLLVLPSRYVLAHQFVNQIVCMYAFVYAEQLWTVQVGLLQVVQV